MTAPLEERRYVGALADMLGHVGGCDACREAKCSRCGLGGFEHPSSDACIDAAQAAKAAPAAPTSGVIIIAQPERDLSDPATKLCPRGDELRAAAHEARLATPAERLVRYWGLESPDVPLVDQWDCKRAAEWIRSDPGLARQILGQLEERREQALEDVEVPTDHLREGFLKGFRETHPSPGPPTDEETQARRAAVERIASLVSERFVLRHRGLLPHPSAVEAFRRGHDQALAATDLVRLADGIEAVRLRKAVLWGQPAPRGTDLGGPAEQADELRKLARWAAERFAEIEREKS